ncbi:hypothetical protein F5B19DRAFT_490948 [Rostrohypoxylon terebratum]|nr:hypothetical protein F5B19DRAFT_490948 [Rostrohypoxylon terebratum]
MKFSTVFGFFATAGLAAAMPSSHHVRSVSEVVSGLKRAASGGFTHVGSDNVVRTFDRDLNVIDSASLDSRMTPETRSPSAAVLEEVKQARSRSLAQVSKPRSPGSLERRQTQPSCVSEFCPDDDYCKGLWLYGYNCTSCMLVTNTIGNCQQF